MKLAKNIISIAATAALASTLLVGLSPASANTNSPIFNHPSISMVEGDDLLHYIGYVMHVNEDYLILTYEDENGETSLCYQILVPILNNETYHIGERLHVTAKAIFYSLPPIAMDPTIERIQ